MTTDVLDAVGFIGLGVYTPAEVSLVDAEGGIWPVGSAVDDGVDAVGESLVARSLLTRVGSQVSPAGELSLALQIRQSPRALTAIEVRTPLAHTRIGYYVGATSQPELVLEEFWWNDASVRFGLRSLAALAVTILTNLDMEASAGPALTALPDGGVAVALERVQLNATAAVDSTESDDAAAAVGVRQCLTDAHHVMTVTSSASPSSDLVSVVTVAHSADAAWLLVSAGGPEQLAYPVSASLLTAVLQSALDGSLPSLVAAALSR